MFAGFYFFSTFDYYTPIFLVHATFMKEDFLHYLWQNKKFDFANLQTSEGESLQILSSGHYLQQEGPDFFNAQIIIGNQKWAGNIEIHLKSSDWYAHRHETDANYDNVILHVVWENDTAIFRQNNTEIPVLVLQNYVDSDLIQHYQKLKTQKSWINCEQDLQTIPQFVLTNWQERLFFERLERKSNPILELFQENNSDWEATLFCFLVKNFGLNTNGEVFLQLAKSIPFSVLRKESFEVQNLEALFFGQANLLVPTPEDTYGKELVIIYDYLSVKYQLPPKINLPVHFFRLRPDNFPTIRLAQLAMLLHLQRNLFSKIMDAKSINEIYQIFEVNVSDYWLNHYNFEKQSRFKSKFISKSFIDLILINTIIPFKFTYHHSLGNDVSDENIYFMEALQPEKNAIIDKFHEFGVKATSAFQTQTLLQLKTAYCEKGRCLQCVIGIELLKSG